MSVRTKMLGFVDVILRVPPIFIIDEILKISMGLPFNTQTNDPTLDANQMSIMDGATATHAAATDTILVNGSSSSSNFSSLSAAAAINSSLEQLLNDTTDTLFGAAAAAAAAPIIADDAEFYKILSLTSLKFFSCFLGESHDTINARCSFFMRFTFLPDFVRRRWSGCSVEEVVVAFVIGIADSACDSGLCIFCFI